MFRSFFGNRRGAVSVIAALSLVSLLGMGGLAVDLNRGYQMTVSNQQVADMAAVAAAVAYTASKSEAILQPTARDLAVVQGLSNATVTATMISDVPKAGAKAVRVTVTMPLSVTLARIVGASATYPVTVTATASLSSQSVPACIIGLASSGNAVETSGGASINTNGCAVAGVGSVVNNGTSITAKQVISGSANIVNNYGSIQAEQIRYAGNFENPSWNGNVPTADKRVRQATTVSDPLANSVDLSNARNLLGTYTAPTNPATPSSTKNWTFSYSPSADAASFRVGNSGNFVVPKGTYAINRMEVGGAINVRFESGSVVTIAGGVNIGGGSTVDFGNGNYKINGGFNSGSNGVTFGNGALHIGAGTVTFSGTSYIGNGPVTIAAPISIGGGTSVIIGAGDHVFGSASGGTAINLGGGSNFFMGDGTLSVNGDISTAGGSRMIFGKTANHLINGNMFIRGGALFGAGRYTINGNFENGTGNSGSTWAYTFGGKTYGATLEGVGVSGFDMAGVNVSFVLRGALNLGGGAYTKLIAPTASTSGGAFADILFDSLTTSDTTWSAGSNNVFVGAVHIPNSKLTMSGGNGTNSGGGCFMLIALRVVVSGGAATGTSCPNVTGSDGTASVDLIA